MFPGDMIYAGMMTHSSIKGLAVAAVGAWCFLNPVIGADEVPLDPPTVAVPDVPISDQPISAWLGDRTLPTLLLRVMPGATPQNQRYAPEYIDSWEVIGGSPAEIPAADGEILSGLLQGGEGFEPLRPDRCKFRPGLSFRSGETDADFDLLVCFACDEVGVVPRESNKLVAVYAFDQPTRDVLLDLAKRLLPDDEAIQELPPVRRDTTARPPSVPIPEDTGNPSP